MLCKIACLLFVTSLTILSSLVPICSGRRRYRRGDECHEDVISVYEVSFFGDWSRKLFPKMYPRYRPHAQWSKLIGRTHDSTYKLWREGELATPTLQKFVEEGNSRMLEVDAQGFNGTLDSFTAAPIRNGVGRTTVRVMANGKYNKISFVVKIVPSPDWFVGLDSVELCRAGRWRRRIHMTLRPLDGGTDKGLTYTSPNWPTHPQEPVYHILPTKPRHPASPFYNPKQQRVSRIAHVLLERTGEFVRRGKKKTTKFMNATNTFLPTEEPPALKAKTTSSSKHNARVNSDTMRKNSYQNTEILPPDFDKVTDSRVDSNDDVDTQTPPLLTQNDDSDASRDLYQETDSTDGINLSSEELTTYPLTSETETEQINSFIDSTDRPQYSWKSKSSQYKNTDYFKKVRVPRQRAPVSAIRYAKTTVPAIRYAKPTVPAIRYAEPTEPTIPDFESRSLFRDEYGQQRGILYTNEKVMANKEKELIRNNGAILDCLVTNWGSWGPCSKTCGFGVRLRKREIIQQPENGGSACPRVSLEALCGSMRTCGWKHFSMFAQKSPRRRRRRRRHHRFRVRQHQTY